MTLKPNYIAMSSQHEYRYISLVMRDYFWWRWAVVELPTMKTVAVGNEWRHEKAKRKAADRAYSFAERGGPITPLYA